MLQMSAEHERVVLAHVADELLAAHVGARRHAVHAAARPVQRVRLQVPPQVHLRVERLRTHLTAKRCKYYIILSLTYYIVTNNILVSF